MKEDSDGANASSFRRQVERAAAGRVGTVHYGGSVDGVAGQFLAKPVSDVVLRTVFNQSSSF